MSRLGTPGHSASCERFRRITSLRPDNQLSRLETALLDAHARRCESCTRFAAEVTAITLIVRTSPLHVPDREVVVPPRPTPTRTRYWRRALHAPALAVIALVVVVALEGSSVDRGGGMLVSPIVSDVSSSAMSADAEASIIRLLGRRPGGVPGMTKAV